MSPDRPGVEVRRVYEADARSGARPGVLVDRLWPRGLSKAAVDVDEWLKDLAPSTELQRWYGHEVGRFEEFARRYRAELSCPPASDALERLAERAASEGVTLLTATRDVDHSAARVLQQMLAGEGITSGA